eukprot:CAMPEP_0196664544 /NCGR_PEP_ID=MMETSP1086-20130531/57587_1 /TAXON_ID=77921 /ORGANISM="Cyanoptyche  gloeocystis , Strain SAG4.97" /LENGTH=435 /DNA_ID=CAMNT_0042000915 /DNA_START=162 /DNA_END=1469 /DNA_ORIENTATION=-
MAAVKSSFFNKAKLQRLKTFQLSSETPSIVCEKNEEMKGPRNDKQPNAFGGIIKIVLGAAGFLLSDFKRPALAAQKHESHLSISVSDYANSSVQDGQVVAEAATAKKKTLAEEFPEGKRPKTKGELWQMRRMRDLKQATPYILGGIASVALVGTAVKAVLRKRREADLKKTEDFLRKQLERKRTSAAPPIVETAVLTEVVEEIRSFPKTSSTVKDPSPVQTAAPSYPPSSSAPPPFVQRVLEEISPKGDANMSEEEYLQRVQGMLGDMKDAPPESTDAMLKNLQSLFGLDEQDLQGMKDWLKVFQKIKDGTGTPEEIRQAEAELIQSMIVAQYPELYGMPEEEISRFRQATQMMNVDFSKIYDWSTISLEQRQNALKFAVASSILNGDIEATKRPLLQKLCDDFKMPHSDIDKTYNELLEEAQALANAENPPSSS